VSVHRKDGKSDRPARLPAPAIKTVVGVPNLPVHPPLDLDMEELSGSLLIEEPPRREVVAGPSPTLPKPNPPPRHDEPARPKDTKPTEIGSPALPVETVATSAPSAAPQPALPSGAPARMAELKSSLRRPAWPLLSLGGLVAIVGVTLVGLRMMHLQHATTRPSMEGPATASDPAPAATTLAAPSSASPQGAAAASACKVAGTAHVVAPAAIVAVGVEARAFGDEVALGFAPSEHQAMLVRLNPSSLSASESTTIYSEQIIRRVTPMPGKKGRLGLAVDADRKGDSLQGRRTLPLDPPVQVGLLNGGLAWAPWGGGVEGKLWPLEGEGAVEAVRGARSESNLSTLAIAFRHAGAIWVGTAERSATLVPKGALLHMTKLGEGSGASASPPLVGSPAIAFNEGTVVVAWAQRPSPADRWQIGWTRFRAGDAAGEPSSFSPPPGGRGGDVMSPALSVVPGGRFLLVWTEGPAAGHEVRALTSSPEGAPIGDPLSISTGATNAGQGQVTVTSSGRGVVAFLESSGTGFHVVATPIVCGGL
jgi:hypothetical protein